MAFGSAIQKFWILSRRFYFRTFFSFSTPFRGRYTFFSTPMLCPAIAPARALYILPFSSFAIELSNSMLLFVCFILLCGVWHVFVALAQNLFYIFAAYWAFIDGKFDDVSSDVNPLDEKYRNNKIKFADTESFANVWRSASWSKNVQLTLHFP